MSLKFGKKNKPVWILYLIMLAIFYFTFAAIPINADNEIDYNYLKQYRYKEKKMPGYREFKEYQILIKQFIVLYHDFASKNSRHFKPGFEDYLELIWGKKNVIEFILLISDRLIRNMSFSPGSYTIDIYTGLALEPEITGDRK